MSACMGDLDEARQVAADDLALIDAAERDFPSGPANLWAHHYGPRLLALARRCLLNRVEVVA